MKKNKILSRDKAEKLLLEQVNQYLDQGEYEEANTILDILPLNNVLATEIKNESYILSALRATKEYISYHNTSYFGDGQYNTDTYEFSISDTSFYEYDTALEISNASSEYPVILISGIIKRGFSMTDTSTGVYTLCYYDSTLGEYRCCSLSHSLFLSSGGWTYVDEEQRLLMEYYLKGKEIELKIDSQRLYKVFNNHKEDRVDVLK